MHSVITNSTTPSSSMYIDLQDANGDQSWVLIHKNTGTSNIHHRRHVVLEVDATATDALAHPKVVASTSIFSIDNSSIKS